MCSHRVPQQINTTTLASSYLKAQNNNNNNNNKRPIRSFGEGGRPTWSSFFLDHTRVTWRGQALNRDRDRVRNRAEPEPVPSLDPIPGRAVPIYKSLVSHRLLFRLFHCLLGVAYVSDLPLPPSPSVGFDRHLWSFCCS